MIKNTILIFFFSLQLITAQDMHFTQFYATPTYLNPAFTGANVCSRFTIAYRNQWQGVNTGYKSYLASYDHFIRNKRLGVGLILGVDESGSGALRTTIINPLISYEVKLNRFSSVRLGLQPGIGIKSINFSKLRFGDQLYRTGGTGDIPTVEHRTQNKNYMDIGAGLLYSYSNCWIGTSFYHLNKPSDSFYENPTVVLPVKYSVHCGIKYQLNKDEKSEIDKKYVTAALHYRGQKEFDQFDIGFYFSQNVFSLGLWYRGIPGLKAYKPGYANNDAVSLIFGITKENFKIGYSYDITISNLSNNTRGTHELTLSFQLCKFKPEKIKRVLISCPKF